MTTTTTNNNKSLRLVVVHKKILEAQFNPIYREFTGSTRGFPFNFSKYRMVSARAHQHFNFLTDMSLILNAFCLVCSFVECVCARVLTSIGILYNALKIEKKYNDKSVCTIG